jgi:AcrR family transcriptional regulator
MVKKPTATPSRDIPARERILRTAYLLFYRDGIRSTGIDKIIAEARVTKVTFYRHFPSKDDLIKAFLERRHQIWAEGFNRAITKFRSSQSAAQRVRDPLAPVLLAVTEWLGESTFRGCAFVNTVAEVGPSLPDVFGIAARHKGETAEVIRSLLDNRANAKEIAWAATLAIDGAVVNAQRGASSVSAALTGLRLLLGAITKEFPVGLRKSLKARPKPRNYKP